MNSTAAPDQRAAQREESRQRAVEALPVSFGRRHPRLDRITDLARGHFDVAMSTVTVLDGDRAWWPGKSGLAADSGVRQDTFCDRTVRDDVVTVVDDTTVDARFAGFRLVTEGGIRFYAGAPLHDGQGNVVATFCLFDRRPRHLDDEQMATFLDLAAWAQQELVDSADMTQASAVQASMLPERALRPPGWEVHGVCLPSLSVGGDFYDYSHDGDVLHVAIGDVMGKGTGAALLGAGLRAALRGTLSAVSAGVDLGVTVTRVAQSQLPDLERAGSFVTLFQAAVDTDDGRVRYVDAGCGLVVLVTADGVAEHLRGHDRPLGVLPDDHWSEQEVYLDPGDRLFVFSDGILDLLDDPDDWVPGIAALAAAHPGVEDFLSAVTDLARARTPTDDVTAVVVRSVPREPV